MGGALGLGALFLGEAQLSVRTHSRPEGRPSRMDKRTGSLPWDPALLGLLVAGCLSKHNP